MSKHQYKYIELFQKLLLRNLITYFHLCPQDKRGIAFDDNTNGSSNMYTTSKLISGNREHRHAVFTGDKFSNLKLCALILNPRRVCV